MHWFWMLYISLYLKHYAQFIFDFLWINKLLCKVQQLFSWKFYCILGLYCSIYWHLKWWGARGCVERETYMKKMPSYLAVNITKTFLHLQLGKKKKSLKQTFHSPPMEKSSWISIQHSWAIFTKQNSSRSVVIMLE